MKTTNFLPSFILASCVAIGLVLAFIFVFCVMVLAISFIRFFVRISSKHYESIGVYHGLTRQVQGKACKDD